ncbi:putative uridine kinase C227.14 isoform X2 [Brassica rapa]|uniref:putative uridine kinase C227.14 isoform X2 n=1 Tax=Brassica campestris TaxID=3711 RepID=UPI00142DFD0B|nr:putative uridine kinase C227.14 isoform X2 [Brassica rapa]
MEVSSFSTVPRFCYSSSVPESCRFRGFKVQLCDQSLVPVRLSIRIRRTPRTVVSCSQKRDVTVVDGSCMDEIYDKLAERLVPTSAAMFSPNVKRLVGLAGPPGAGKSTLAYEVVSRINRLWPQKAASFDDEVMPPDVATVLPMDGFHLYRSQLDAMEDPKEAHARRGAPWTFNPALLLNCLKKLRNEGSVYVPSFDHGVGDPVEDDIFVSLQHKVVIVEGNYLLLEEGTWKDISDMFDEKCVLSIFISRFIDVNLDTAMERVEARHISTGKPPDVAKWRIDYNDRPNAELIVKSKTNADVLIRSISF